MESKNNINQETPEILIVEDSPPQAVLLQKLLEKNGYKVSVAVNGVEALSYLEGHLPALIISDIIMPEMDGYELSQKVKARDELKDIPIILLTQLTEPEDIVRGLGCGADNFITKPYDRELLLSRIRYVLVNQEIRKDRVMEMGIEVFFAGKKHFINSDRIQILDLLFSTYENAVQQKRDLEQINKELKEALETIKKLEGILPICAKCKKIRDDKGNWIQMEKYIRDRSEARFSHSICPECAKKLYPDFVIDD